MVERTLLADLDTGEMQLVDCRTCPANYCEYAWPCYRVECEREVPVD